MPWSWPLPRPACWHFYRARLGELHRAVPCLQTVSLVTSADPISRSAVAESPVQRVSLAELQRAMNAPDLKLEDSVDTGRGIPARHDAAFTARLLQCLVQHYQGRIHPSPLALHQACTVRDLLHLFAELDREDAVRKARDPVAWRTWKLEQLLGISSEAEIPPNVTIDPRLLPDMPPPRSVPYTRQKIRERLAKVFESARNQEAEPASKSA
jgi:hypothetical protein